VSLRRTLADRLNDTWHGAPWYGSSSDTILADITADMAARRIAPGTHTIWELVLHITAWTETAAARVRGIGSKNPDRGDWPIVGATTPDAWAAALGDLQAARTQLLGDLSAAHEEDLHLRVKEFDAPFASTATTRAGTVTGLIEHDIYHLGQIALLKKVTLTGTP
jgi:uncharacterized damage-inducible protein DinB